MPDLAVQGKPQTYGLSGQVSGRVFAGLRVSGGVFVPPTASRRTRHARIPAWFR